MENQNRKVSQYLKLLEEKRWRNVCPVEDVGFLPTTYKQGNILPDPALFRPFGKEEYWGEGPDTHAWFRFSLPEGPADRFLRVRTDREGKFSRNPQFLVYVNGEMRQGMDVNHTTLCIGSEAAEVYLYAYTGQTCPRAQLFVDTASLNANVERLYYDLLLPYESLALLHRESDLYAQTLLHLWRAVSMLDLLAIDEEAFSASVARAEDYIETVFYGEYCGEQRSTAVCIGHTHIDCAWLWTLKQTREKVQRSFSTVLELMRRYPEYRFTSSQPYLYKAFKEEAPELYEELKARVREGRWECEGAMWVEADCNIPSGESLVRQLLHGKRFFREEFGKESRVLWLPDVFGYSAALPQILKKSGVDWFVTSKISWNDTNRMPYDTFRWRGIDGSEINTYFLTAQDKKGEASDRYTTYNGNTHAAMLAGTCHRYAQKQISNEALLAFGYGDGGGGPTAEHLELLRRGEKGIPGLPNTRIAFVGEFLDRLAERIGESRVCPAWQGELYLEFHRGTYTTMSRNKRNNRRSEFLYRDAELYASLAHLLLGKETFSEPLRRGWEMILTNQFHDIIPGSSIQEVYEQSDRDYAEILRIGEEALAASQSAIAHGLDRSHGHVVFNPNPQGGRVLTRLEGRSVFAENIPANGYAAGTALTCTNRVRIEGREVETDLFRVSFDEHYQISSLVDKRNGRELIREGEVGNELRLYADYPDKYDAWEWEAYSREEYIALTALSSVTELEDGVRRGLRLVRPYGSSTVTQTLWFYDDEARIDLETVADWHEKHRMLKAVFPVAINADKATYDIQFGSVERPTHFNTSWDQARFEVCAHKYADLSDGGYGVSLISDCKYGYDIHEGVMQLSLLRSPTHPNPEADQGEIRFTYSLSPHVGTLTESDTVRLAYAVNAPAMLLPTCGETDVIPSRFSAVEIDAENLLCETVKPAEEGEGTVLRLYECKNRCTRASLRLGIPARRVWECDLMERPLRELPLRDGCVELSCRGFEILTLLVEA